ncbi:DNA adenine methylase [Patescibacteria group bacterium]|nr:DNA adenine methylase [Patescibacteria group bacterium]MBU4455162.1 DNA adenine methylase [Patescibacteria group bacterium]
MKIKIKPQRKYHFSPLRYPGGKTSLLPFFDDILKKNCLYKGIFIEPYAGGAGSALSLLLLEKVENIVINDFDPAIYAFWKSLIFHSDKFISKIKRIEINVEEWREQKKIYSNKKSSEFKLGFATFFLNRTNQSGIIEGGPIGGVSQEGKWKIDARFNKDKLIEKIKKISLYKDRITVLNMDGIKLASKYAKKKNVLIYLDPPYYMKGSLLYLNHYNEKNHLELANFLNKNKNLNWILTYDNVKQIKQLYTKRRSKKFSINYSANKNIKGLEIMIFSDKIKIC